MTRMLSRKLYLSVRVVCGLESEILNAHLAEEHFHETFVDDVMQVPNVFLKLDYIPIRSASVRSRSATTPST